MSIFTKRKEIIPEVLWAIRGKLPERLEVEVVPSEDGGYSASVKNLAGCFTQGKNFNEVYQMVNSAVYDYLEIPEQYFPYIQSYTPPKDLIEQMQKMGEKLASSPQTVQLVLQG